MTIDDALLILDLRLPIDAHQVRSAYRHKARIVHPDLRTGQKREDIEQASSAFQQLTEARDLLLEMTETAPITNRYREPESAPRLPPERGSDRTAKITIAAHIAANGGTIVIRTPRNETVRIRIQEHTRDGAKMRLPGKGNYGLHGGANGDLFLIIMVESRGFCPRPAPETFDQFTGKGNATNWTEHGNTELPTYVYFAPQTLHRYNRSRPVPRQKLISTGTKIFVISATIVIAAMLAYAFIFAAHLGVGA